MFQGSSLTVFSIIASMTPTAPGGQVAGGVVRSVAAEVGRNLYKLSGSWNECTLRILQNLLQFPRL